LLSPALSKSNDNVTCKFAGRPTREIYLRWIVSLANGKETLGRELSVACQVFPVTR
jgi:hypothetical protein